MSNYPDDIRSYDNDPRSPFYTALPECRGCEEALDEDGDCSNLECELCHDYYNDQEYYKNLNLDEDEE